MSNIKDVAKLAGVSIATVSRFINNKGYVSDEAKQKIQKAVYQLNYRPNLIARSLSMRQDNTIGLLIPDITNPFFPELARAIEDVCLERGYTTILCNTDNDIEKERSYIELLKQKYVAGMILTTNLVDDNFYKSLNMPIVGIDRVGNVNFPKVLMHNEYGGKLAAQELIGKGSKDILLLSGPSNLLLTKERTRGFLQYAQKFSDVKVEILPSYFNFNQTYNMMSEYLEKGSNVDGIFACNDTDAIAAIKAMLKHHYQIPEEVQIVGFDGISLGIYTTPSLTSVAQNIYQVGEYAAKLLIAQIEGELIEQEIIYVEPQLVIRDSTRKE